MRDSDDRKEPPRASVFVAVAILAVWGAGQVWHLLDPKGHAEPTSVTPLALLAASFLLSRSWPWK